jgi:hypothetical protein
MCEACLTAPIEREIENEVAGSPFKVCQPCAHRLENLALRPLEWYRLSVIHGPAYLLYDDFYNEAGKADQNRIPVKQASLFPAPKLKAVANDLDALLDYSLTRWHLTDETVTAFKSHKQSEVLSAISMLVKDRPGSWVETRCYEIAASVLGPVAEEWVRSRWETGSRPAMLYSFIPAVVASLPHEEAIPMAITAVEQSGVSDLSVPALTLSRFHSPKVIDWIEGVATSPVSNRWGLLAARSGLSWATIIRWLKRGRPMSLVAMDALGVIMRPEHGGRPSAFPIAMKDAPSNDEILAHLREYARHDPVPRVTQMIDRIVTALPKHDQNRFRP